MSLADAFAPYENHRRNLILASTFGHLAPEERKVYRGSMIFTLGAYGDEVLIQKSFKELDDSPWLYEHIHDFIARRAKKHGAVYKFVGTYRMLKNGAGRFSGKVTQLIRARRAS